MTALPRHRLLLADEISIRKRAPFSRKPFFLLLGKNIMKISAQFLTVVAVFALALIAVSCEVKQTKKAEMPEVKVEGGQAPEVEVETAEITVEEKEIDLPDTVTVPDIDVTMPDEKAAEESSEAAKMSETPAETEMAPSVEPKTETTPETELEMAPSVEPESETTPAKSEMTPSVE